MNIFKHLCIETEVREFEIEWWEEKMMPEGTKILCHVLSADRLKFDPSKIEFIVAKMCWAGS